MASIPSLARPPLRLHRPGLPLPTMNSKLRRYSGGRGGMRGRLAVCKLRAGNSAYTAPSSTDHGSEPSVLSLHNRRAKKRRHGPRSWVSLNSIGFYEIKIRQNSAPRLTGISTSLRACLRSLPGSGLSLADDTPDYPYLLWHPAM